MGLCFATFPPGPADSQVTPYLGCSQFLPLSQVEAIIHPRFLEQLLSPETQLDPLALAEELEQEEALTPGQVSQGREETP